LDKLFSAQELLLQAKVSNPAVIVDASHENCRMNGKKDPILQMDVVREVMHNLRMHPELQSTVKGFMVESFIKNGCQKVEDLTPETIDMGGLSVTDPCLGWDKTEELILDTAKLFSSIRA
jgi:3-deoxy-7-phosphoheptulonate synthase